jgi:hypothetical protein
MARIPDETERRITSAIAWMEARLVAVCRQYEAFLSVRRPEPFYAWIPLALDPIDQDRSNEFRHRITTFSRLIEQQKARLANHRRLKKEQRQPNRIIESDPDPLLMAVPRADALTVKIVDRVPSPDDYMFASQIDRRAEAIESWNYSCLGRRKRSRRYEGFGFQRKC